jgi:uncharacterized protein
MTTWLWRTGFAVLAALIALPAQAASFDCAEARAPDEIAICANPQLSALDSEMGGLWYAYSRVPMLMGSNGNRQDAAQAFLATRRQCGGDVACLTRAYTARNAALKSDIDAAMADYNRLQNGG